MLPPLKNLLPKTLLADHCARPALQRCLMISILRSIEHRRRPPREILGSAQPQLPSGNFRGLLVLSRSCAPPSSHLRTRRVCDSRPRCSVLTLPLMRLRRGSIFLSPAKPNRVSSSRMRPGTSVGHRAPLAGLPACCGSAWWNSNK